MDATNEKGVSDIVIMSSAQVGKTEIINNIVGYHIDVDPCPMLVLQPTLEMADTWSKDRLAPMLRDTPALRDKVGNAKSRHSGNTVRHKTFPGGHITMAGANSPASLASRPIRIVLFDEVSRYPVSAGTEGDPVDLATKRTTTFWNSLRIMVSTPTKVGDRIDRAYSLSDQRKYFVPCPECGEKHVLEWKHMQWDKDKKGNHLPETGKMVCPECGILYGDENKMAMLEAGDWVATQPFHGTAGFHICELYSPWVTFGEMVKNFLKAKDNSESLKTWVNTALGETFEEDGESLEADHLYARREHYNAEIPDGVLVIAASGDVQDDRVEMGAYGFGVGEESWPLDHAVFHGDPGQDEIWKRVDEWLLQTWETSFGVRMGIHGAFIDSGGHHTKKVYKFCKGKSSRHIYPIRGGNVSHAPIVGLPSKKNSEKVKLFTLGVDAAKAILYGQLKISEPGVGYCHFPIKDWCHQEYFEQLAAEKRIRKLVRGFSVYQWVKMRARNEQLDLFVYAYACLLMLNPIWELLLKNFNSMVLNATLGAEKHKPKQKGRIIRKGVSL